MERLLVIKNVSFKIFSFFNGGWSGDQGSGGQTGHLEGVLVIKNVSVKLFSSFNGGRIGDKVVSVKLVSCFNGGSIGDPERVCPTHQLLQWRVHWWSRTCLSNYSASLMEGIFVMKNVSLKIFSFFNGGWSGDQGSGGQTGQLEGVLVIKNGSVKFSSFFNGRNIVDHERVCQTLQLLQWR